MASAAFKYVPQSAATTFAFSSVCFFFSAQDSAAASKEEDREDKNHSEGAVLKSQDYIHYELEYLVTTKWDLTAKSYL